MELTQNNTALLVFSLSAEKEHTRKPIFGASSKKENTSLFELLIQQTKKVAYRSGIDVFWVDEHLQTGHDFSTRFANAFQDLFDAGYENVVSIGNDCPDLSHEILKEAVQFLQTEKVVFGPSADGGVYLLGLRKEVFDFAEFRKLPWQTANVQRGLNAYFRAQKVELRVLVELNDLDSPDDARAYAASGRSSQVRRFIRGVLSILMAPVAAGDAFSISSFVSASIGLRAPPLV